MMKVLVGIIFFFMAMSGCLAQTNMDGQVFLFHKQSNTSYVRLIPEKDGPFDAITVCMKSYTDLGRSYSLFSLNTPSKDNDFLLFPYPYPEEKISVSVGSKDFYFHLREKDIREWRNTCVTWESSTGLLVLWINGKPYPQTVFQKGYNINAKPIIIIGQEQDSYGKGFDIGQSFIGEITDVHMWDAVLSYKEMSDFLINKYVFGNVINWFSLKYEKVGDVSIAPYRCPVTYNPCFSMDTTYEYKK
ncbi:mucosal pentraxin-like [Discoglossus pictus]